VCSDLAKVRLKIEAWLEIEDDLPVADGKRIVKAREVSLTKLGKCLEERFSTKDISVRHIEVLQLISEL